MSITAGEVAIDAKRLAFPAFISGKVSDASLVAMLASLETDILMQIHQIAPWLVEMESVETVVKADNKAGYILTGAQYGYSNFTYYLASNDTHYPIAIVADVDQYNSGVEHPAGYMRDDTFLPVDPLGLGWEDMTTVRSWFWSADDKIKYNHHVSHTPISTLSETLNVPDFTRSYIIAALATQILLDSNAPETKLQVAIQREQKYWNTVLMHMYKAVPITSRVGE